jgi:hypothetical protein
MNDQARHVSRPWRRILRFSVRGLIVVVLVICGWLGWVVRCARIQCTTVAELRKAGAFAVYDWNWKNGRVNHGKPWRPKWLVDAIGIDYFGSVNYVGIFHPSEKVLFHSGQLGEVQELGIVNQEEITDGGLAHVKGLTKLSKLNLFKSRVTDAGMVHLKGVTGLKELNLNATRITDSGLANLEDLTKLSDLNLSHTIVTNAGMAHLKKLTKLAKLDLNQTHVTDAGVKDLQQALPTLKISR